MDTSKSGMALWKKAIKNKINDNIIDKIEIYDEDKNFVHVTYNVDTINTIKKSLPGYIKKPYSIDPSAFHFAPCY